MTVHNFLFLHWVVVVSFTVIQLETFTPSESDICFSHEIALPISQDCCVTRDLVTYEYIFKLFKPYNDK